MRTATVQPEAIQSFIPARPLRAAAFGGSPLFQRKCACGSSAGLAGTCSECQRKNLTLQRRSTQGEVSAVPPIVHDVLRSPGQPLDRETREFMEPRFGHDFSRVRIHKDDKANRSAQAVNAFAYTGGHSIVFGAGQYAPNTAAGLSLLAHELTHVLQQTGFSNSAAAGQAPLQRLLDSPANPSADQPGLSQPGDPSEQEADRIAAQVMQSSPIAPVSISSLVRSAPENLIQRKVYGTGGQTYLTTTFDTNRERPTQVEVFVRPREVPSRGRTPIAISLLHDPADPTGMSDVALGYDGGHILGLSLGGDDRSYNIVPMYPGFNRGTWKNVENAIKNDATLLYSGMHYGVRIDIGYAGTNDTIPSTFTVVGMANKPVKGRPGKTTRQQVKNYGTKTQPNDIEVTEAASEKMKETLTGNQDSTQLDSIITKAVQTLTQEDGNAIRANFLKDNKHLPKSAKTDYPDDPAQRPYEYLDILTLARSIDPKTSFSPGRLFSAEQRKLIIQTNMARNSGTIRSDDTSDPHAVLSERGAANFPEIDHIIPKSLGGSNWFSNARVVSWQLNNKEDRVKNISGLVNTARLALPALPSGTIAEQAEFVVPRLLAKAGAAQTKAEVISALSINYSSISVTPTWRNAIGAELEAMVTRGEATKDFLNRYQLV